MFLGAQKNIGTDLLSIHNICFGGEIRKLILSGVLISAIMIEEGLDGV